MLHLAGKRILVTRPKRQASSLAEELAALGAEPIVVPAIEIVPPDNYIVLDDALERLEAFDWLVFTSANAVEVFAARRLNGSVPPRIAVIGPSTAKAVESLGLHVDLLPERYVAESLAEALAPLVAGKSVLLVRAEEARDLLPKALGAAGSQITIAPAYRNRAPVASISTMGALFGNTSEYPDAITLTSGSSVRSLLGLLDASGIVLPREVPLASIGPITSESAREAGYEPAVEADSATTVALVQALIRYFETKNR